MSNDDQTYIVTFEYKLEIDARNAHTAVQEATLETKDNYEYLTDDMTVTDVELKPKKETR